MRTLLSILLGSALLASAATFAFAVPPGHKDTFRPLSATGAEIPELRARIPGGADPMHTNRALLRASRAAEPRHFATALKDPDEITPTNYGGYFNILHQHVALSISPPTGEMDSLVVRVDAEITKDEIAKIPMAFPQEFEITSVVDENGEDWDYTFTSGSLVLEGEEPFLLGTPFTVVVTGSGTPYCGSGYLHACSFNNSLSYVTHAQYYAGNSSADIDLYTAVLEVTVPAGFIVAGTGKMVDAHTSEDGEFVTWVFSHDYETHLLSFSMADYQEIATDEASIPIRGWIRDKHMDNKDTILNLATNIVGFYESVFGPFPFENLDIVEIHNNFSGGYGPMATIMMMSDVFSSNEDSDYYSFFVQLMSHEIGHQYWGNLVNILKPNSVTLSEGMAEFSSALHWQEVFDSSSNFIGNGMTYMYTIPGEEDVGIGTYGVYSSPHYQTLAYDKASVVFNMLRLQLGDEAFFAGIEIFIASHGYGAATLFDFFESMEIASGEDLSAFFEQWFNGIRYPRLEMSTETWPDTDGSWMVQVTAEQIGEHLFDIDIPITVTLQGDHRRQIVGPLKVSGEETVQSFRVDGPVLRVDPDQERNLLQRTWAGAAGDLNLSGEADGSDLIDMAIRHDRNIVFQWGGGGRGGGGGGYFYPNAGYLTRYDLNSDGKIDSSDVELLMNAY